MENLRKIGQEIIAVGTPVLLLALAAALVRVVMTAKRMTPLGFVRGIVVSAFVAMLTGFALQEWQVAPGLKYAVIGMLAFVADDLLIGILRLGSILREDPKAFLQILIRRV